MSDCDTWNYEIYWDMKFTLKIKISTRIYVFLEAINKLAEVSEGAIRAPRIALLDVGGFAIMNALTHFGVQFAPLCYM